MLRNELTDEQAQALLATCVRNHLATPGITFPIWEGFDLSHRDGQLVRTSDGKVLMESYHGVIGMSDAQIERVVLELPEPIKPEEPLEEVSPRVSRR